MKLPSINSLWLQTLKVFLRFPLQVLLAIVATGIWWYLIDVENYNGALESNLVKLLITCNLALTLLLASDLYAEVKQFNPTKKWLFRFIALTICAVLFFTLHPTQNQADIYRLVILGFAFHLLVSFSPFIGNSNLNGFWHYNKTLFLRFLTSVLYAAVLFGGLALALAAINGLFNVTIDYKIYLKLFAVVGLCFTTLFFLAGLPDNISSLNQDQYYPKGLKIFTQYVLIPLVTIYLGILLVYEIKIAINWELPKGLVSTLVLGYAVFGILSLLLIYPIKNNEGNGWMKLFSRFFYVMMLPLIVLLILAIVKRVGSYGITEPRYYLIILALWLSGVTLYFLLGKNQNIKTIPISLCIVALLTVYGPQSAFSVSKLSQIVRLKKLMQSKLSEDQKQQSSVIRYLVSNHGLASLQSFTSVNLSAIESKLDLKNTYEAKNNKTDTAFAILKVSQTYNDYEETNFNLQKENKEVMLTKDYDYCILANTTGQYHSVESAKIKIEQNLSKPNTNNYTIVSVTIANEAKINFMLHQSFLQIYNQYQSGKLKNLDKNGAGIIPNQQLQFTQHSKNFKLTLVVISINGSYNKSSKDFSNLFFDGYVLIKKI